MTQHEQIESGEAWRLDKAGGRAEQHLAPGGKGRFERSADCVEVLEFERRPGDGGLVEPDLAADGGQPAVRSCCGMSVQPRCGFAQPLGERLGRPRGQPGGFDARSERATAEQGRSMLDIGRHDGEDILRIEAPLHQVACAGRRERAVAPEVSREHVRELPVVTFGD